MVFDYPGATHRTFDKLVNRYINVNFNAHFVREYITRNEVLELSAVWS